MKDLPYDAWIVCAANRRNDGLIVAGARHYDSVMLGLIAATGGQKEWAGCEQGFIDQRGKFYTRKEARVLAHKNQQIKRRVGGDADCLFSENLY